MSDLTWLTLILTLFSVLLNLPSAIVDGIYIRQALKEKLKETTNVPEESAGKMK